MKIARASILILIGLLYACEKGANIMPDAHSIINKALENTGARHIDSSDISFVFRDKAYRAVRNQGIYQLERYFQDSSYLIKDVLSNSGFERFKDHQLVSLPDSMKLKYSNAINSVHYFSILPYGLQAPAVNKKDLGLVKIKGQDYHKIQVTFNKTDGGTDFEDVFLYWISAVDYKMDYLAYEFHVNGGGLRFREAYNERYINGIRFVDYNNYKPKEATAHLEDLDSLFQKDALKLLSKIDLEQIQVH